MNIVKDSYDGGACPDCIENIPIDVSSGDVCRNCGHIFYAPIDTDEKTEEVCDECGSANIGYDAWVKDIDGKLEIVGGPFDYWQCLNDLCKETEPNVRRVPVENLKYCDAEDCSYHGDKGVMREKKSNEKEPYWYCSIHIEKSF
jgi:hypothetical protein